MGSVEFVFSNPASSEHTHHFDIDAFRIMRFEEMLVWKRSARLATEIFILTKDLSHWGFRDQITRSALSIASNIAEGAERNSSKELVQFLGIAKGSCGELRTQLYIAMEAGILDKSLSQKHIETTKEITAMLYSLIRSIKEKMKKSKT